MTNEDETNEHGFEEQVSPKRRGTRRPKGDGCVRKRPDGRGRWEWIGKIRGKKKSIYARTQARLMAIVEKTKRAASNGLPVLVENQTVAQFVEYWLRDVVKPSCRPRTFQSYELTMRLHIIPELGHLRLGQLADSHVQRLINDKVEEGSLSPRSVAYIRSVLRHALNYACDKRLVPYNVVTSTIRPRIPHNEIRFLDDAEARRFLAATKGTRYEPIYIVALHLGLRRGEILGLRWQQDIDLDKGTVRVNQALQRVNGKLRATEPKTEQSRRTLVLPPTVLTVLRAHRTRQLQERLQAGPDWQDSGLVFTTPRGTPIEPRNLVRNHVKLLNAAGLPHIPFKNLRHSCASLLLSEGVELRLVQEILGHTSIVTTAQFYAGITPKKMREAANVMQSILG